MLSRPGVTGAGAMYTGDGENPAEIFNCISEDIEDQEETCSRPNSPDILSLEETSGLNQVGTIRRPLSLTTSEERPSEVARRSIENQLADILRASSEASKAKIAFEEKRLAMEKLKIEQTLALERERLELDKSKALTNEMHAKLAYAKFLLDSGIYSKEEIKDLLK